MARRKEALETLEEEVYNPSSQLEIPQFGDEDQYVYRWIRFRTGTEDDYTSISTRMRQGWKFVQTAEAPENFLFPTIGPKIAQLEGCITVGDLVLGKIARSKSRAMQKWAEDQANGAEAGFNERMIRYNDDGTAHQFVNDGSRRVTRGRRPSFG